MLGLLAQILLVLLVVVGFLAPFVLWLEARPAPLWQPAVDLVKRLSQHSRRGEPAARAPSRLHALAPALTVLAVIAAFVVVPFGGRYRFGERELSLVAVDVDWGLPWVLALLSLSACVGVFAGLSARSTGSRLGALRVAAQLISWQAALGVSLAPMLMIFGSFGLSEIALAQDAGARIFALLAAPSVPAWGVLLNPPACAMFLVCAMAASQAPPFDAARAGSELAGGSAADYSGAGLALITLAGALQVSLVAALVTLLFLGGWSLPWLPQARVEAAIAPYLGEAVASLLCLALHVGSFLAKLVALIWLQLRLRDFVPRIRYDQLMDLCWKLVLPWSLANVLVTALVLLALETE